MSDNVKIFAKISAKLYLNVKVQALASKSPRAFVVWVNAITYAVDMRTDGYLEEFALKRFLGATQRSIDVLCAAGLLEHTGDGVYYIHDFSDAQTTSEQIDELRSKRAEAGRKGMASRWGNKEPDTQGTTTDTTPQDDIDAQVVTVDEQDDIEEPVKPHNTVQRAPNHASEIDAQKQRVQDTLAQIEQVYPPARFDGYKSSVMFDMQFYYPRLEKAAKRAGYQDPYDFLIARVKAYVATREPTYVKKFSTFFAQEEYATNWQHQPKPKTAAQLKQEQQLAEIEEMDRQTGWI